MDWTTEPAFYQSFDGTGGYVLMEGENSTTQNNFVVPGKVKSKIMER